MLPPIRYPLPTLIALILASLLTWQAAVLSRGWRAEMAARAERLLQGPPVPSSPRPMVVAGPMTRRALLLHEETPATDRPNGSEVETIDRRMFVDVYDTWPSPGPVSHVRIGNRKAIGWVKAVDVLEWDTRLVIRSPEGKLEISDRPEGLTRIVEVGPTPLPVLSWTDKAVEVALWDPAAPWSSVSRRAWVRLEKLPGDSWGVWISQVELPILLDLAGRDDSANSARLRAVLGRLADSRPWTPANLDALRPVLPRVVFDQESNPARAVERLAEANARTTRDAGWSGLSFRFLPISDLP